MKPIVFLLVALLTFAACSQTTVDPNGQSGQAQYGTYMGHVTLHGVNGDTLNDRSGVLVALDGTSHSVTTDANGHYVLPHVPTGTYNLRFTKAGFDTAMILGDHFIGIDSSLMATQHLQAIPFDSIVCDRVEFFVDSIRSTSDPKVLDTSYAMFLYVRIAGEDNPSYVSLTVSRE